jgi:hypothetical protein
MYWHTKEKEPKKNKYRVIQPWGGLAKTQNQENILVHYGTRPHHFKGCIGVGFLERAGSHHELRYDRQSLEVIWEHAGGKPGSREFWNVSSPRIVFRVLNAFPNIETLKPHSG